MLNHTKRYYIEATYEILRTNGLDGFSIRNVAKKVGCASSVLYRHFKDMDHLLTLGSIRFLRDYIIEAGEIEALELDPISMTMRLWECFARYAFSNIPIFERLFFEENVEKVQECILEYYEEFPIELENIGNNLQVMMTSSDVEQREYTILKQAVAAGQISETDAQMLVKTDNYLFRGMLQKYRKVPVDLADWDFVKRTTEEYISMLRYARERL